MKVNLKRRIKTDLFYYDKSDMNLWIDINKSNGKSIETNGFDF